MVKYLSKIGIAVSKMWPCTLKAFAVWNKKSTIPLTGKSIKRKYIFLVWISFTFYLIYLHIYIYIIIFHFQYHILIFASMGVQRGQVPDKNLPCVFIWAYPHASWRAFHKAFFEWQMTQISDNSADNQSEARISIAYMKQNCHLSLMTSFVKRPQVYMYLRTCLKHIFKSWFQLWQKYFIPLHLSHKCFFIACQLLYFYCTSMCRDLVDWWLRLHVDLKVRVPPRH